jgi:methyl coenzyme M reductase subunit C-like uncharacterized protein (methanogenesis marker protein 7)
LRLFNYAINSPVFSSAVENVKVRIYKTIILPVVLYGYETWSLTLREEHRLRVFENRVLRRIIRLKKGEVMRGRRKLHNDELRDCIDNILKVTFL